MANKKSLHNMPSLVVEEICLALLPKYRPPYKTFADRDEAKKAFEDIHNLALTCRALDYIPLYHVPSTILRRYRGQHHMLGFLDYVNGILTDPEAEPRETMFDMSVWNVNDSWARNTLRLSTLGRELLVEDAIERMPQLKSITIYTTGDRAPTLPRLTQAKIILLGDYKKMGWSAKYVSNAPNLEVLEIEGGQSDCVPCLLPPKIRSITLSSTWLIHYSLRNFLGVRNELREFVYRSARYKSYLGLEDNLLTNRFIPNVLLLSDILSVLIQAGSLRKIETLEVDIRRVYEEERDVRQLCNSFHFVNLWMKQMPLKTLRLTQQLLWIATCDHLPALENGRTLPSRNPDKLINFIPECIEYFQLADVAGEFLPCILHLADHIRARKGFANLIKVHLRPSPLLVRKLLHGLGHESDANLMYGESEETSCEACVDLIEQRRVIVERFEEAGVEIEFPIEVLPLHTNDRVALQRQLDLCHWCPECHMDDSGCPLQDSEDDSGDDSY
ncbi:hypothetical protein F4821DRAFT_280417 [Hypoxylon rubiginosum]|uniref:Uncharacterized protein n=1 Tax=Hypoxylon rubiginosum TaxID=110542 RepID=A0ACC0CUE8_9PEZI|nr:hypothetical protein F4821DRAFT_280417 [Hypoxylon rubiginosum]